jgi:spectinomycin phosphotransferase
MREKPGISEEQLRLCLQEQYDLISTTFDFLPLGLDSRAGVYRVVNEQGASYLLKARSNALYEPACLIPRYLYDQGIASVVAPLPTRSGALWAGRAVAETRLGDWTVIVYPFINGDTSWTGMTDEQWRQVGTTVKQIHLVVLPSHGFELLRKETFDPTNYALQVRTFETQHIYSEAGGVSERVLRSSWLAHQTTISTVVASLEKLARVLRERSGPYVICHADLHPANLLRTPTDQVFVIDWDEVMLAPKERDFIFVRDTPAASPALPGSSAFFQGYGPTEIDWTALTYYHYERVIQDLIECAEEVFLREELEEETKADAAQLFQGILAEDGEITAAHAAAARLPSDLTL